MKGLGPYGQLTANTHLANREYVPEQSKTCSHGALLEGTVQNMGGSCLGLERQRRKREGEQRR